MGTIVMVGTPHLEYEAPGNDRIAGLEIRLDYLIRKLGVQVVMEEWSEKRKKSVANLVAERSKLPWANVGTPDEPQYRTCTPYINHPAHEGALEYDPDAPEMCEYGPFETQENRERRMAENVRAEMEEYETGLFVLGTAHLHSMFGKLQCLGFKVAACSWQLSELLAGLLGTDLHVGDELAVSYGKVVEHRKALEFERQQVIW